MFFSIPGFIPDQGFSSWRNDFLGEKVGDGVVESSGSSWDSDA